MDRKSLFILLMRICAVVSAALGLLTALLDFTIAPALVSLAVMFLFRFLAVRELRREAKERGE